MVKTHVFTRMMFTTAIWIFGLAAHFAAVYPISIFLFTLAGMSYGAEAGCWLMYKKAVELLDKHYENQP